MGDYDPTFASLSKMLRKHAAGMSIKTDEPGNFYVEMAATTPKAKPRFFGAVQSKKSYVSYHLMPVYEHPALLDGISDALRKRMQGKSCFNFTTDDRAVQGAGRADRKVRGRRQDGRHHLTAGDLRTPRSVLMDGAATRNSTGRHQGRRQVACT